MGSVRCVDAEKPKFVIRHGTGHVEHDKDIWCYCNNEQFFCEIPKGFFVYTGSLIVIEN
jgi:hypothetical protein